MSRPAPIRIGIAVIAAALTLAACSSSTSSGQTTTTPTEAGSTTQVTDTDLRSTFQAIGNPDADVVIVNTQGGPTTELFTDELAGMVGSSDPQDAYVVTVHQAQTIDPSRFIEADIDFEAAKAADTESVRMLADVVDHFTAQGKKVFVVGISFGAFMAQDLLATYGNQADGYLIMVGRLDMPESVWSEFSQGRTVGFVDGVEVVPVPIEDAGMGAGSPEGDRNMARLAAGLGHKRYTELLAEADLSNVVYVYGNTDEHLGRLTQDEIDLLIERGAEVVASPGGHGEAVDANVTELLSKVTGLTSDPSDNILTEDSIGELTVSGVTFAFAETGFEAELEIEGVPTGPAVLAVTDDDRLVIVPIDPAEDEPTGIIHLFDGESVLDADDVEFGENAAGFLTASGTFAGAGDEMPFSFELGLGVGTSTFEINGNQAVVRGTLGSRTFLQMQHLLDAHPEVDTLVLQQIDGSENDEVNVETGRLVRSAAMTTIVPADGAIFSGGVDLFAAGAVRLAEPGATLGVHAWCCGPNGESAHELDQSDPAHGTQLAYFTEMLGPDLGPRFYFFTLQAAPFDGIENMTPAELDYFDLVTDDSVLAAKQPSSVEALSAPSPAELASDLAERLSGEVLLVFDGDPTTAVIAIGNTELLTLTMTPTDGGGWTASEADGRLVCSTGVTAGRCD